MVVPSKFTCFNAHYNKSVKCTITMEVLYVEAPSCLSKLGGGAGGARLGEEKMRLPAAHLFLCAAVYSPHPPNICVPHSKSGVVPMSSLLGVG
jgi:hypothetical protein